MKILYGTTNKAKLQAICNNCNLCVEACPVNALNSPIMNQEVCWDYAFGDDAEKKSWRIACHKCKSNNVIEACKECVKKYIRKPEAANFIVVEEREKDDYGRIYLFVEVECKNSFGMMVSNDFHVFLQSVNEDGTYDVLEQAVCNDCFMTEAEMKYANEWNVPKK